MVAALTTSLPETPGGIRNWDYRYTWIRDATFALWGLHVLGLDDEARDFMDFVESAQYRREPDADHVRDPRREGVTESTLSTTSGYEDSQPVRIGNAAYAQRQNDVYGALLDSIYIHARALGGVSDSLWELAISQVEQAIDVWEQPDQGIWEARDDPKHYVSSKLMCWVAVDRGSRLAAHRGEGKRADAWRAEADRIKDDILTHGVSDRGVLRQHYDTDELDASTLLAALVRFLPGTDELPRNTVLAIRDELTENGLVLRYRVDRTEDGLHGVEGTFSICSSGSSPRSRRSVRRRPPASSASASRRAALDLYAEEMEPHSGRQLGNFLQAFTHLALINAVSQVIADEQAGVDRDSSERAVLTEMLPDE